MKRAIEPKNNDNVIDNDSDSVISKDQNIIQVQQVSEVLSSYPEASLNSPNTNSTTSLISMYSNLSKTNSSINDASQSTEEKRYKIMFEIW